MSISPVPATLALTEMQPATAHSHAQGNASGGSAEPITEREPKPEATPVPKDSLPAELPQDEVEVQRDMQSGGEIVVRYIDSSGDLILQVPTEQVLEVARAIDQNLEREQTTRALGIKGAEKESTRGH
jgi:uncharacterized FlaG/YvyC family protein